METIHSLGGAIRARLTQGLGAALNAALDVVAPPVCLACPAREVGPLSLCSRCVAMLRPVGASPCPRCAAALGPGRSPSTCGDCGKLRPKFAAAVAAAHYAGFAGELVRRAKYGGDAVLGWPLERMLVDRVLNSSIGDGISGVLPVPTTSARRRERGFHLSELLACAVGHALSVPTHATWLVRIGDPAPQAALSRTERRRAVRGTVGLLRGLRWFPTTRRIAGQRLLVVDDVLTTGATVNECARVLLDAGAAEVRVAVVARA